MLECLRFLLEQTINFIKVLFRVDVGFTSLGVVFCIVFILFPMILAIVMFLKTSFVEELDDRYDESRPYHIKSDTFRQTVHFPDGQSITRTNSYTSRSRRRRR